MNPGSKWIYAQLLSTDSLPFYDLEKSRDYINDALGDLESANEEQLEDFIKLEFDKGNLMKTFM